jgi:hypothetical protein
MPVLGVRVDGALCFSAGEASRKGKNLARDPRCVIMAGSRDLDLVVQGEAARVRDRPGSISWPTRTRPSTDGA